jgi:hypothetical protein
LLNLREIAK